MKRLFPLLLIACAPDDEVPPLADCDTPGHICVVAGIAGTQQFGADDVAATESGLNCPVDSTVGPDGTLYVVDWNNHRIRHVDHDGVIRTVVGSGMLGDGVVDENGDAQPGPALEFLLHHATDIAFGPDGAAWIAAWQGDRIDRLDLEADWVDLGWGTGLRAFAGDGGSATLATFDLPVSVVWDDDGYAWISDQGNAIVRRVRPDGVIETVLGTPKTLGYAGDGGPGHDALLRSLLSSAADPSSKIAVAGRCLFIADTRNQLVRRLDLDTLIVDRFAGTFVDNDEEYSWRAGGVEGYAGDGGPALEASLANPRDVAVGPDGEVYIADTDNHCVRVVLPDGTIHTFAGTCTVAGRTLDAIPATDARLDRPYGVTVDDAGNVYIADTYNHVIRRVAAGGLPGWDRSVSSPCGG